MKARIATLLAWAVPGLLLQIPAQWVVGAQPLDLLTLPGEWCVCVALAAYARHPARAAHGLALAWTLLLLLESVRTAGRLLTAADPQLYDLLFLAEHLVVLVADLWGPAAVVGGLLGLVAVLVGLTVALGRVLRPVPTHVDTQRIAPVAAALALLLSPLPGDIGGRWVVPDWTANVLESTRTWQATRQSIGADPYGTLEGHPVVHRPDIALYVVESYGRVLDTTPPLHDPYHQLLDALAPELRAQGFHVATGWATATVSGGRSWISDASVLLGVGIGHQSTWSHVQPHTGRFTHLPAWLAANGYRTTVCRPKDRARMGLEIRNDFGWHHSVFADDIAYDGTLVGWGGIPDQYSLGVLHTRVLPGVEGPRFTFFHGVSAHGPWDVVPVLADDWHDARDQPTATEDSAEPDTTDAILRQAKRFGDALDQGGARLPGRMFPKLRQTYLGAIDYSLRATVASLSDLPPADGHLVVIYGDHQPPFIARPDDFDVPVHVLATDPTWLEPFLAAGFVSGLHPDEDSPVVPITALYPLLARALTGAPLPDVPTGVDLRALATPAGE